MVPGSERRHNHGRQQVFVLDVSSGGSRRDNSSGKFHRPMFFLVRSLFWYYSLTRLQAAVLLGQRKKPTDTHPLRGSVLRRMGLFSNFADSTLCSSVERTNPRMVEMTMSKEDYAMA